MRYLKHTGFTLVELLIATTVFSVIMIISMYGFIKISKYYSKGMAVARMQDSLRNVTSDISGNLQFSSGDITGSESSGYYCVGNKKYTFNINWPQGFKSEIGDALVSEEIVNGNCSSIVNDSKKILLSSGTRVLKFTINPVKSTDTKLYNISIAFMYAPLDNEASFNPNATPKVAGTTLVDDTDKTDLSKWKCKGGQAGSEYCTISTVSTMIYGRINNE